MKKATSKNQKGITKIEIITTKQPTRKKQQSTTGQYKRSPCRFRQLTNSQSTTKQ
jgi:hypothetical protein